MHAQIAPEENRLLRSIPAARLALIERIARAGGGVRSRLTQGFLRSYFRGVAEDDLAAREPAHLARAALAQLALAARRKPGGTLVRVFNPDPGVDGFKSAHTLVLTVTDDMPFLVDSIGMALGRAEAAVHLIVHPVLQVRRDARGRLIDIGANGKHATHAESWQLFEIDHVADPARLAALQHDLEATLADVRVAVTDWAAMRARMRAIIGALENDPPQLPATEVSEARALLEWMEAQYFVFLGYRRYRLERGRSEDRLVPDSRSGLGILSDYQHQRQQHLAATVLRGELRARARAKELLVITKANSAATVHRGEYLDYVGVKTFDSRGNVDGEHRFLGLWVSTAYHGSPRDIPVLREKVTRVIEHFGLDPTSHDGKAVLNALETYPRDELFQASVADLVRIVRGVVNLYERHTVRLLARRDPYHRFYSCLVYVPRDRYNTDVRHRIERIALVGFAGTSVESHAQISGSIHARLHVVVRTDPHQRHHADLDAIERNVAAAALTWTDQLREVLSVQRGEAYALALTHRYRQAFPLAYQDDLQPAEALDDLADLEALRQQPGEVRLTLRRPAHCKPERLHLKIIKLGDPHSISDVLPMLENFGLRVIAERPYELAWPEGGAAWIQDFELEHRDGVSVDIARSEANFREAFAAAWSGAIENDGFNRLLLGADLAARQIVVLRAYCRYLLQTGVPFSQAYMERTLTANTGIARNLLRLFAARFDPALARAPKGGERNAEHLMAQIRAALDGVASLDDDRILRAYLNLVRATLRTNFYQTDASGASKSYVSFKFDPALVPDLPLPRPKFEIFVYSPRVEGVHLRMGQVARGGLRWSDRREDFRTEVLGLMKAQNVKNTLIVPVGAKGGFVPKRLPASGTREEVQAEVIACYQTFIRGLLDLTDNIVAGRIAWWRPTRVPPRSRTLPTPSPPSTASGSAMPSPPAARRATTTRKWASRRAAPGSASSVTSANSGSTRRKHPSRLPGSATCRAMCSATACCSRGTSVCRPRSIIAISSSTRIRTLRRASPSAHACSPCRARAGTTTIASSCPAAAGCSRARLNPSPSPQRHVRCWDWRRRAPRPTKSCARFCACRSTCCGTAASALM
jgi:glutamate dehydrogenase